MTGFAILLTYLTMKWDARKHGSSWTKPKPGKLSAQPCARLLAVLRGNRFFVSRGKN